MVTQETGRRSSPQRLQELKGWIQEAYERTRGAVEVDGEFTGITSQQLYNFGTSIVEAPSLQAIYSHFAQAAPTGDSWYDVLFSPAHLIRHKVTVEAFRQVLPKKVKRSLDIATGTGLLVDSLAMQSEHITAIDINPDMLKWAERRLQGHHDAGHIRGFETRVMNALDIETDLPRENFSLVVSNGLFSYLNPGEVSRFYTGVQRVLQDGGLYAEHMIFDEAAFEKIARSFYTKSPKFILALAITAAAVSIDEVTSAADVSQEEHADIMRAHDFVPFQIYYDRECGDAVEFWQKV